MGGLRPPPDRLPPGALPWRGVGAATCRPWDSAMMIAGPFHPPFSFPSCGKENGPWTVQKKRPLFARLTPRRGSPESVPVKTAGLLPARAGPFQYPDHSPALASLAVIGVENRMAPAPAPAAAPWSREGRSAAATAQPFAALPPYAGQPFAASPRYGDVASPLRGDAAYPLRVKAERKVSGTSPGLDNPKGSAFPSLITVREGQPSPAGGRRSAHVRTDPPNIFSFPPAATHFLFDVSKRKWGAEGITVPR